MNQQPFDFTARPAQPAEESPALFDYTPPPAAEESTIELPSVGIPLSSYNVILVNTSAGKDSQAMLWAIVQEAAKQKCLDRVRAVHCDLGRAEWGGVVELAQKQCDLLGVPLTIVKRPQGDLVDHIRERGMFPGFATRYCTSQHKTGQVAKVMTEIGAEWRRGELPHAMPWLEWSEDGKTFERTFQSSTGPVRILNCLGLRKQESSARAKRLEKKTLWFDKRASNGRRHVETWHPIADWTEEHVWHAIKLSGLPHHEAYDLGMPRLSCALCIYASPDALTLAARHNRELYEEYVAIERETGHTFKPDWSLEEIRDQVESDGELADVSFDGQL